MLFVGFIDTIIIRKCVEVYGGHLTHHWSLFSEFPVRVCRFCVMFVVLVTLFYYFVAFYSL